MNTDKLKNLFPDILSLEKAIKDNSEDLKFFNNFIKVLTEDAELLQRLATNEPLN
ncbi:MAG: hypothetical protein JST50_16630 [Bacteroidetes bacterium]|nr:hypothetical protein [Bacteroidota bacterium]